MYKYISKNKGFTSIVVIQGLIILYLFINLFAKKCIIDVSPIEMISDGNVLISTLDKDVIEIKNSPSGEIRTESYDIKSGAYTIRIEYLSQKSIENASHSLLDKTATFNCEVSSNPSAIKMNVVDLDDGHTYAEGKMWASSLGTIDDFKIKVNYLGEGKLIISDIILEEQISYRYLRLIGYLIFFIIFNFIYCIFFFNGDIIRDYSKYKTYILLCVIIFISSMPLFSDFIFLVGGHDTDFHMQRIVAVADELKNAQFPVRIMTTMLNGYGYVNSIYYCDIFLYFPAVLYNLMLPLRSCYQIYVLIVNISTCLIAYYVFYKISDDKNIGTLAAGLYSLSSYRLTNLYVRAALGEYTAMIFLPLIFYGIWNIYDKEKCSWKEWMPLTIGMSGIICSHVLTTEMVVIFLIIFSIVSIKKILLPTRIFALIKATIMTLLLSAWFVVPFIMSMINMPTRVQEIGVNKIQKTGLYPIQLLGIFQSGTGGNVYGGMKNEMPLSIGIPMIVGLVIVFYCCIYRNKWKLEDKKEFKGMKASVLLSLLAMIMTLYIFPYDYIESIFGKNMAKIFGMVQYSWRYLVLAMVLSDIAIVFALLILKKYNYDKYIKSISSIAICIILFSGVFYWQYANSAEEWNFNSNSKYTTTYIGAGEYLLENTDSNKVFVSEPIVSNENVIIHNYTKIKNTVMVDYSNMGDTNETITLPIFNYDNYHAYNNENDIEIPIMNGENNRIQIQVPLQHSGSVRIEYIVPIVWRISEMCSIVTSFVSILLIIHYYKRKKSNETKISN